MRRGGTHPGSGRAGTIVKGKTPCILIRAGDDIGIAGAAATSPPAAGIVSHCFRVRLAASRHCGRYIGNLMSLELLEPFLNVGGVHDGDDGARWGGVQGQVEGSWKEEASKIR